MGMSSSQARLLSLTARQHDIEYKAQKLEAQKLQLANESDRVYDEYICALDAKKMQYKAINSDGSTTFKDANLRILENGAVPGYNGETSNNTYLVQNAYNGDIYVTPEFAAAYGITGGGVQDPGDLDTWLANHGCTTEEVMQTVTDYSNVTGATPVQNVVAKAPGTQTVSDANTYSITGTLASPTDNTVGGTTSYSVTGNTPTVSSTDPVDNWKYLVNSNTTAGDSVSSVKTSSTTTINSTTLTTAGNQKFKTMTGLTFQYKTTPDSGYTKSDLDMTMQELSDKYGWNMVFNDSKVDGNNVNELTVYWGNDVLTDCCDSYIQSKTISYTEATTLNELLTSVASKSGATYNSTNGTLTANSNLFFISSDDAWVDTILSKWLSGTDSTHTNTRTASYGAEKTLTLDTKIYDYLYSNQYTYSGTHAFDGSTSIYNSSTHSLFKYNGSSSMTTITFRDYYQNLKTQGLITDFGENSDGSFWVKKDGSTPIGSKVKNTTTTQDKTQNDVYTVTINPSIIAENIYLAQSIIAGKTDTEYNADHSSSFTALKNKIATIYGSSDQDKLRQLALLGDTLELALSENKRTGSTTPLYGVITPLEAALNSNTIYNITSDDYVASSSSSLNTTYTFALSTTDPSFTPSTTKTADGTTPGTLTVYGSDDELKAYLAKSCYDANNSKTYEQYLSSINTNGYNTYQLAELVKNLSTYKSQLIAGTDLKSSLTAFSSSTHTLSQLPNSSAYTVTNTSTSTEYKVSVASADDIADRLAYDIYVKNGSTGDPNTIKSTLGRTFSNNQLASLSYYYSDSTKWNNIVTKLAADMSTSSVSEYLNKYAGYTISYDTNNAVSINTTTHSHEETVKGLVNIPQLNGIASNLVAAFRKSGKTVIDADVLSKLTAKYGTDNDTNNLNLANINKAVCEYLNSGSNTSSIDNIYNVLFGSASLNVPSSYDLTQYNISRANLGTCTTTYGTKQEGTGVYQWVQNETYYDALESYNAAKALTGKKFVIVTDEQASSANFVNNLVLDYGCNLLKFDTSIDDMSGTSISVETCLQEVSDETDLKKAEAKYEADMKRIDRKDAKYDTQLAAVETERSAIKEEVETLKTVIKENAERTFKLFS